MHHLVAYDQHCKCVIYYTSPERAYKSHLTDMIRMQLHASITCLSNATQAGLSPPSPFGYTLVFFDRDCPGSGIPPIPGFSSRITATPPL